MYGSAHTQRILSGQGGNRCLILVFSTRTCRLQAPTPQEAARGGPQATGHTVPAWASTAVSGLTGPRAAMGCSCWASSAGLDCKQQGLQKPAFHSCPLLPGAPLPGALAEPCPWTRLDPAQESPGRISQELAGEVRSSRCGSCPLGLQLLRCQSPHMPPRGIAASCFLEGQRVPPTWFHQGP